MEYKLSYGRRLWVIHVGYNDKLTSFGLHDQASNTEASIHGIIRGVHVSGLVCGCWLVRHVNLSGWIG